jgi:hypothetical protein
MYEAIAVNEIDGIIYAVTPLQVTKLVIGTGNFFHSLLSTSDMCSHCILFRTSINYWNRRRWA